MPIRRRNLSREEQVEARRARKARSNERHHGPVLYDSQYVDGVARFPTEAQMLRNLEASWDAADAGHKMGRAVESSTRSSSGDDDDDAGLDD